MLASAEEIPGAVIESGSSALGAPSGPVYLGVPTDLLSKEVPVGGAAIAALGPAPPCSPDQLDRARRLLAEAQRPLIWAGGGALRAGAGPLVGELALELAAPVITTYMSRGLLAPDHPCAVPGPVHAEEVGALWDEADVVLAIGTDFDGTMTQNWQMPAPPTLISVNVDEAEASKNYRSDLTLVGDARAVLAELAAAREPRGDVDQLARRLAAIGAQVSAWVQADDEHAARFLEVVHRALPPERWWSPTCACPATG